MQEITYISQDGRDRRIFSYDERATAYIKYSGEVPFNLITWRGFTAHACHLMAEGWQIKQYYNPYIKKIIIKLINPDAQMVGTVKLNMEQYRNCTHLQIHNIHAGGTQSLKKQPALDICKELTQDDVGMLLESVNILLEPEREKYIKSTTLPTADIKYLKEIIDEKKPYYLQRKVR